jgi:fructose-bisphosphate aldolase class I
MDLSVLQKTAQAMVVPGKGVLAIDESHSTCKKRFEALGVECTEDTRREYRELLITAPGLGQDLGGMILFDETLRQSTRDGRAFVEVLKAAGILPGIKVDTGAKDLALHPGEQVTEGLDGLRERLVEYRGLGAAFAKWRAVINISDTLPSEACVVANAHALARYAALCQEANIVPMVEPEMIMDGSHSVERCYEVTTRVLKALFGQLQEQGVALEGTILKVSMVLPGKMAPVQISDEDVAKWTVKCLKENVPVNVAGVVFLSGGQTDAQSTLRLNAMHTLGETLPWPLSFSYGRGIQQPALEMWAKDRSAFEAAQKILVHRAHMNALASQGKYTTEAETAA